MIVRRRRRSRLPRYSPFVLASRPKEGSSSRSHEANERQRHSDGAFGSVGIKDCEELSGTKRTDFSSATFGAPWPKMREPPDRALDLQPPKAEIN